MEIRSKVRNTVKRHIQAFFFVVARIQLLVAKQSMTWTSLLWSVLPSTPSQGTAVHSTDVQRLPLSSVSGVCSLAPADVILNTDGGWLLV